MDQAAVVGQSETERRLPDAVQRVSLWLRERAHVHAPVMLDAAARTAQQAADALGVELGQIAKSIVFCRQPDLRAVLVIASGDRRVDERKVAGLICGQGQVLGRADADFVKRATGFSIGGVSPVAHLGEPLLLIDRELARFGRIWAAAGHPHAVFQLTPDDLCRLTQLTYADVVLAQAAP